MKTGKALGTLLLLLNLVVVVACRAGESPAPDCGVVDGIEPICGLQKPEDLVVAPNGRDILFGQFAESGSLALLDTRTLAVHRLYPAPNTLPGDGLLWGDADCKAPPGAFQPHGIDLTRRPDGRWQLLVVNHGGRESVEFFEVSAGGEEVPRLTWRGCAPAPEQGYFNDVAALPDGGFLVTHMVAKDSQMWHLFLSLFGADTGFVYRWSPGAGYRPVPGTEGKMPNGIAVSPDGRSFFVNQYFDNELRKYELDTGQQLGEVELDKPDNLSWNPAGKLYVASQHAGLFALMSSLDKQTPGPSLLPFSIYEIDPDTLEKRLVLRREGLPMGAGTVAVELGGYLYIGSYVGDRMIRLAVPAER